MEEDIQATDAPEQVEQEKTTLTFGQGQEADTQESSTDGQVDTVVSNWNEDKRFKEHWGEDPNKMYESLRFHEKRQGDYDNLKGEVESLGKFREDYNSLEKLFEHPQIGTELLEVINKHQNPQQYQQNQQTAAQGQDQAQPNPYEGQMNEMLEWKKGIEQQALNQYQTQQQETQFKQIDEFAKQYNVQYDKNDFLKAMTEGNVDPQNWVHYFKSQATDVAMKNSANKAAENALRNKSAIPSSVGGQGKLTGKFSGMNVDQALDAILG